MSHIALLYGDSGTTQEFFLSWLRGEAHSGKANSVLASTARSTREDQLEQSLLDQVQARPHQPFLSYAEFLKKGPSPGDLVLATHCSEEGDFGVAFRVANDGVLVSNQTTTTDSSDGFFLPTLNLPESVAAPFSLALAGLCALHGLKPGRFPIPFEQSVIIGRARVSAQAVVPLKMPRKTLHRVSVEAATVIFATTPQALDLRRDDAARLVQHGRTFEKDMSVFSPHTPGKVVLCASGPSAGAPGQLGAWAAFYPEFRGEPSILRATSRWHRFAEGMLKQGGLVADLRLGHSTGRWAMQSGEPVADLMRRLDATPLAEDLSGAVREVYAAGSELEAASARGAIWQAWLVLGPIENVEKAIGDSKLVEIIERRGALECVIAGFPAALDEVMLELLNSPRMHATEVEFDLPLHSTAAHLHSAELQAVFGVDGLDQPENIQAEIEAAWQAGGRIFIDLGPRAGYAHWVPRVLEGRDFQVVALDPSMQGPNAMIDAFVRLSALGLPISLNPFEPIFEANAWARFTLPEQVVLADWVKDAQAIQAGMHKVHLEFLAHQGSAFEAFINAHQAGLQTLEKL